MLVLFHTKFACNLAFKNLVFMWESCKGVRECEEKVKNVHSRRASWLASCQRWSFSPGLTLSFFSLKNCPSRSTCFAGWWQCRLICLVWINFCTIGVVFVLGWWLFMGILVNLGLSSLLPTSLVYYMVFVYGVCLANDFDVIILCFDIVILEHWIICSGPVASIPLIKALQLSLSFLFW